MTNDDRLRSLYAAADETIAELNALNAAGAANRSLALAQLRTVVAGLSNGTPEEIESQAERRLVAARERDVEGRPRGQEQAPFVALPERTTPGGPFGRQVRDRLVREALAKSDW